MVQFSKANAFVHLGLPIVTLSTESHPSPPVKPSQSALSPADVSAPDKFGLQHRTAPVQICNPGQRQQAKQQCERTGQARSGKAGLLNASRYQDKLRQSQSMRGKAVNAACMSGPYVMVLNVVRQAQAGAARWQPAEPMALSKEPARGNTYHVT